MESSTNSDIRTVSAFLDKSLKNKFVFHMAIRQWERNVCFELQPGLRSFLERGVIEKFFNKVDVSQQHPAATVPFQAQGIESITGKLGKFLYFVDLYLKTNPKFNYAFKYI